VCVSKGLEWTTLVRYERIHFHPITHTDTDSFWIHTLILTLIILTFFTMCQYYESIMRVLWEYYESITHCEESQYYESEESQYYERHNVCRYRRFSSPSLYESRKYNNPSTHTNSDFSFFYDMCRYPRVSRPSLYEMRKYTLIRIHTLFLTPTMLMHVGTKGSCVHLCMKWGNTH